MEKESYAFFFLFFFFENERRRDTIATNNDDVEDLCEFETEKNCQRRATRHPASVPPNCTVTRRENFAY